MVPAAAWSDKMMMLRKMLLQLVVLLVLLLLLLVLLLLLLSDVPATLGATSATMSTYNAFGYWLLLLLLLVIILLLLLLLLLLGRTSKYTSLLSTPASMMNGSKNKNHA